MITKNDLINMEIENANFEELEKSIDDSIKDFHGSNYFRRIFY